MKRLLRALPVFLLLACAGARDAPRAKLAPPHVEKGPSPCDRAREMRARLPKLLEQGKLDRTVRVARRAEELCEDGAQLAWSATLTALSQLDRDEEAGKLARAIEETADAPPDAKEAAAAYRARPVVPRGDGDPEALLAAAEKASASGDHAAAKEAYLALWRRARPLGRALAEAGRHAKAMHQDADAQRLFDRALVELERDEGKAPRPAIVDGMSSVAWDDDGKRLAAMGTLDGSPVLFVGREASDGPELTAAFPSTEASDSTITFLRGGRAALRISPGALSIVDLTTGAEEPLDPSAVDGRSYVFADDGATLFAWSPEAPVRRYDLATGQRVAEADAPPVIDRLVSLGYLEKAHRLYATGDGFYLYDASFRPTIRVDGVPAWAISSDQKLAATAVGEPPVLTIHDVATAKTLRAMPLPHDDDEGTAYSVAAFSPDDRLVALASYTGDVALADTKTGHARFLGRPATKDEDGATAIFTSLSFTADGKLLCGQLATLRTTCAFDVATGKLRKPDAKKTTVVGIGAEHAVAIEMPANENGALGAGADRYPLAFTGTTMSADEKTIALYEGGEDGVHLIVVDVPSKKVRFDIAIGGLNPDASSVRFAPDGKSMLYEAGGKRGLVDTATGRVLADAPHADVVQAAFRSDGAELALPGAAGGMTLVDTRTGRTRALSRGDRSVLRWAISGDGRTFASSLEDWTTTVWDLTNGTSKKLGDAFLGDASALDDSGKRLAVSRGKLVSVAEIRGSSAPVALDEASDGVMALAFDHTSQRLFGSGVHGGIDVWNVATGQLVKTLVDTAHTRGARFLAIDPKGKWLSATAERLSDVWDLDDYSLARSGDRSGPTAFSPDGKLLVVGNEMIDFSSGRSMFKGDVKSPLLSATFTSDAAQVVYSTAAGVVSLSTLTGFAEQSVPIEGSEGEDPPPPAVTLWKLVALPEAKGLVGVSSKGEAVVLDARGAVRARFLPTGEESAYVTTDRGAVELLGSPRDAPVVVCAIGDALVAFEVCAERLVDHGAFARALEGQPEPP